jgi:signal transduction histidine kinase
MLGGGLPIETTARARSAAALAAAVLVAAFGAFDVARGAPSLALVLAARGVWFAALLVVSRLVRDTGRRIVLPAMLAAGASIVALSALTYADGGAVGGSAMFLLAAPLFIAVLVPDELPVAIFAATASTLATMLVFAMLGWAPGDVAIATVRAAVAGGFAIFGTVLHARVRRVEASLAEELASSERLRALAEPLAAAGTKVGALAHDMSSPLATVKCNLEWLWEAVQDGRIRAAEDEVMEVLDDAREATDRLREGVGALRQAARQARGGVRAN